MRDDAGLCRVGFDSGGKMRSLGEPEERGMDQDQDERSEKGTGEARPGESATQRARGRVESPILILS